jgi:hypothetical protein
MSRPSGVASRIQRQAGLAAQFSRAVQDLQGTSADCLL